MSIAIRLLAVNGDFCSLFSRFSFKEQFSAYTVICQLMKTQCIAWSVSCSLFLFRTKNDNPSLLCVNLYVQSCRSSVLLFVEEHTTDLPWKPEFLARYSILKIFFKIVLNIFTKNEFLVFILTWFIIPFPNFILAELYDRHLVEYQQLNLIKNQLIS